MKICEYDICDEFFRHNHICFHIVLDPKIGSSELEKEYSFLDWEFEEYSSIKKESKKMQYLSVRKFIKEFFKNYLNETITFKRNKSGKLVLMPNKFNISLSYSNNCIALIISKSDKIGVDTEEIRKSSKSFRSKIFLQNKNYKVSKKKIDFYTLWTLIEAIIKSNEHSILKNLWDIEIVNNLYYSAYKKGIKMNLKLNSVVINNKYVVSTATKSGNQVIFLTNLPDLRTFHEVKS